jgi:hypothetical protein
MEKVAHREQNMEGGVNMGGCMRGMVLFFGVPR